MDAEGEELLAWGNTPDDTKRCSRCTTGSVVVVTTRRSDPSSTRREARIYSSADCAALCLPRRGTCAKGHEDHASAKDARRDRNGADDALAELADDGAAVEFAIGRT